MRKTILTATACLLSCFVLSASPITPEEALQRIGKSIPTTRSAADLRYVYTFNLSNGEPGLYVFENSSEYGYLILSADDLAAPMLGYSEKGKFDEKSMPPDMKWWLGEYARQIEYARTTGAKIYADISTRADKAAIAPLISTKWNQGSPYNLQTPEDNGRHCVTGCVATAMAQVMKHWNYPESGTGTGECTVNYRDGNTHTERMLLNEENFDWDNMLDTYDESASEIQKSAVAYLMKACGYSVSMKYSTKESGAPVLYVATALANNFFYNPNLQYCQRGYYEGSEWNDMIYDELIAGRPVVYGGQSDSGGHCFICDGYDSNGYFHFNWGWGGMSDGYFLLNALNPGALGVGANGGGYNFGQEIVRGIQPTEGQKYIPNFIQQGNLEARMSGIMFTLSTGEDGGWFNMDTKPITIDIGAKIEPLAPSTGETTYAEYANMKNQTLQVGYGWRDIGFSLPSSLPNGTYRLTLCYRLSGTEEWTPVRCQSDCYNYIEFTKEGTKFTIEPNKKAMPKIEDAAFLTPLYYGDAVKMSVTVSNPSGKEITNFFYPALYSGGFPQMKAEGVVITILPGETVTKEFICMFDKLVEKQAPTKDTEYQLYFYDPTSSDNTNDYLQFYAGFSKDVTMKIDNTKIDLTVDDFSIKGYDTYETDGRVFYNVQDPSSIPFSLSITNNTDYFAKPVILWVFPYIPGEQVQAMAYEMFTPFALLNEGEQATLGLNLNFSAGEIGKSYFAVPYVNDEMLNDLRLFFTLTEEKDGIDSIEAEEISIVYDKIMSRLFISKGIKGAILITLNGTVYDKTSEAATGSIDLSKLPSGLYIVKATATDGTTKTIKIMR